MIDSSKRQRRSPDDRRRTAPDARPARTEKATFGAGCFWQVEKRFREVDGVVDTAVGYEGGARRQPDLRAGLQRHHGPRRGRARSSTTPRRSSFETLVEKYFEIHDPTQLNRQGPDVGSQYRSVIFTHSDEQAEVRARVLDATQPRFASRS